MGDGAGKGSSRTVRAKGRGKCSRRGGLGLGLGLVACVRREARELANYVAVYVAVSVLEEKRRAGILTQCCHRFERCAVLMRCFKFFLFSCRLVRGSAAVLQYVLIFFSLHTVCTSDCL